MNQLANAYHCAPVEANRRTEWGIGDWTLGLSYSTATKTHGEASIFGVSVEEESSDIEQEYYDLVKAGDAKTKGIKKSAYFMYQKDFESGLFGVTDSKGEVLLDCAYQGFSLLGDDKLVAYSADKIEIYRCGDMSLEKTLPYRMSYYDGENSVVQADEYSFYLGDSEGNPLSAMNNGVTPLELGEGNTVFACAVAGSWNREIEDRSGQALFTVGYEPEIVCVEGNQLAIQSRAGFYLLDDTGNVVKVYRLWGQYTYDEATNTINGPAELNQRQW